MGSWVYALFFELKCITIVFILLFKLFQLLFWYIFWYIPILFFWSSSFLCGIMRCSSSSCIFLARSWNQPLLCRTLMLIGEGCLETEIWVLVSSLIVFFPGTPFVLFHFFFVLFCFTILSLKTYEKLELYLK